MYDLVIAKKNTEEYLAWKGAIEYFLSISQYSSMQLLDFYHTYFRLCVD